MQYYSPKVKCQDLGKQNLQIWQSFVNLYQIEKKSTPKYGTYGVECKVLQSQEEEKGYVKS